MSIKVSDLVQADLLQDLTVADSGAVVGGTGYRRRHRPSAVISVPAPTPGTASGGSIANFTSGMGGFSGTGIGFGSASGSGFTAASSNASVSGPGAGGTGGSASAAGGAFTGGISGIINGTFDRV